MPVDKSVNKWDKIISAISTSESDWVTTSTPYISWITTSTTPYTWTTSTSTTPITAGTATITMASPPDYEVTHSPHLDLVCEYEFPFLDTYNFESPNGREKYIMALKNYLNFYIFTQKQKED